MNPGIIAARIHAIISSTLAPPHRLLAFPRIQYIALQSPCFPSSSLPRLSRFSFTGTGRPLRSAACRRRSPALVVVLMSDQGLSHKISAVSCLSTCNNHRKSWGSKACFPPLQMYFYIYYSTVSCGSGWWTWIQNTFNRLDINLPCLSFSITFFYFLLSSSRFPLLLKWSFLILLEWRSWGGLCIIP